MHARGPSDSAARRGASGLGAAATSLTAGRDFGQAPPSSREVGGFVLAGVAALVAVMATVGLTSIVFEAEVIAAAAAAYAALGLFGLAALVFVSGCLILPMPPPDVLLVVISKSDLADSWLAVVPALGLLSAVAGSLGFLACRRLAAAGWGERLLGATARRHRALIERHGAWAVALGALTPVPYSVMCWGAGLLGVPAARVLPMTLLRVPRFVLYYAAIVHGEALLRWLL